MNNTNKIFSHWSWKKFILDTLFFLLVLILLTSVAVTIGIESPMQFTGKEILSYLFRSVCWGFITKLWHNEKQLSIPEILYNKFK